MTDLPTPLVRAGLILLAAFVGMLIGLGTVAETDWPVAPTVAVAAGVTTIATWWASRSDRHA